MLGSSPALRTMLDRARAAARSDQPVFLWGESGTGKDLLAQAIHAGSSRASGNLVILNAGAVPDDILDREIYGDPGAGQPPRYPSVPPYLAQAQGGTLYIDDVCRMSLHLQARLLALLRRGWIARSDGRSERFTARLISATNTSPTTALKEGKLRRDLYDMLAVEPLNLPPLRARDSDASEIAAQVYPTLLEGFGFPPQKLPPRILARIDSLPWPGNVRQLLNVLRRMALSAEAAAGRSADLPIELLSESVPEMAPASTQAPARSFAEIERRAILEAIERNDGSVQRAADELALAASTIYRKLKGWQQQNGVDKSHS
ncbi:sigma 54-interacting transcriptional regulator [Frigidibacter sp. ROC022]|uniref:sigma 54-interacting transcriptional regulator n=1 Tax=Frigidibacter sp. ROC022 TaxID=2971796 RepID=UPI00215B6DC3|nr:sigma 54-interacting transcriptional regulator [Frigidibacter sp. ROC022]MCR8723006.1 sigma 54-interacting transcriptional regulator [Frigidibacter sp. ROC022]